MFFKILVISAVVLSASAQEHHHATSYSSVVKHVSSGHHQAAPVKYHQAPVQHIAVPVQHAPVHHQEEHYPHHYPKYEFKYGVEDKHTHDIKSQHETRDGDVVKGEYTLLQPDGRTRIVHYTVDKHSGFKANVEYKGHAAHPEPKHH